MRVCSGAGCLRAIADDARFCDDCKPTPNFVADTIREHTLTDRERYRSLYSSPRWQRTRLLAIKACPICARCQLSVTEIVDHIVPAGVAIQQVLDSGLYRTDRYAGFYLLSNLQGLCRPCHWLKTNEDKLHTGAWPDVIAREQAAPKRRWSF
jgi:5-methylcytosine-specific restriction endonuclease McrA